MSIVRHNLMTQHNYTPYCGNMECPTMPRTIFNGEQFVCPRCTWVSEFPTSFIDEYIANWSPEAEPVRTDREVVDEIQQRSTSFEYFSAIGLGYAEALANSVSEDREKLLRIVQKLLLERDRVEQLPAAWRHNQQFMTFKGASIAKQEAENCAHDLENLLKVHRLL